MKKTLGIVGVILLAPAIVYFLNAVDFYWNMIKMFQVSFATGQADPKVIAGRLAQHITSQILSVVVLLPGIFVTSVAALKFKINDQWFKSILNICSWLLTMSLPLLTLFGLYCHWLKRRVVA